MSGVSVQLSVYLAMSMYKLAQISPNQACSLPWPFRPWELDLLWRDSANTSLPSACVVRVQAAVAVVWLRSRVGLGG